MQNWGVFCFFVWAYGIAIFGSVCQEGGIKGLNFDENFSSAAIKCAIVHRLRDQELFKEK